MGNASTRGVTTVGQFVGSDAYYMFATSSNDARDHTAAFAEWYGNVPSADNWEVFVHIPNVNVGAEFTANARYDLAGTTVTVSHRDGERPRWHSLGTYYLDPDTRSGVNPVRLTNYTDDAIQIDGRRRAVAVDAVKWVRRGSGSAANFCTMNAAYDIKPKPLAPRAQQSFTLTVSGTSVDTCTPSNFRLWEVHDNTIVIGALEPSCGETCAPTGTNWSQDVVVPGLSAGTYNVEFQLTCIETDMRVCHRMTLNIASPATQAPTARPTVTVAPEPTPTPSGPPYDIWFRDYPSDAHVLIGQEVTYCFRVASDNIDWARVKTIAPDGTLRRPFQNFIQQGRTECQFILATMVGKYDVQLEVSPNGSRRITGQKTVHFYVDSTNPTATTTTRPAATPAPTLTNTPLLPPVPTPRPAPTQAPAPTSLPTASTCPLFSGTVRDTAGIAVGQAHLIVDARNERREVVTDARGQFAITGSARRQLSTADSEEALQVSQ